jgi:heme oxygenase
VSDLESDLRIDLDELKELLRNHYLPQDLEDLGESYKKKSTRQLAKILKKELM